MKQRKYYKGLKRSNEAGYKQSASELQDLMLLTEIDELEKQIESLRSLVEVLWRDNYQNDNRSWDEIERIFYD